MIYPRTLKPGGCIGIAAPAFPMGKERTEKCAAKLQELGYRVKLADGLKEGRNFHGYLAGSGEERAEDLNAMFADPEIDGIICIRGGYGSAQTMKYLDYGLIRENPKVFVGYSDITNLLNAFAQRCGFVTYHGPMVSSNILEHYDNYTRKSFLETIGDWERLEFANDAGEDGKIRPFERISGGKAQGRLIGGNVTVMGRMMGTFYQPDSRGCILFLEDVDEHIASLDMYLTQMENAGFFEEVSGILLGDFTGCIDKYEEEYQVEEFLRDKFSRFRIPVLSGLQVGHCTPTGTLPIGAWCEMDADQRTIEFIKK